MQWTNKPLNASLADQISRELGLYRIVAAVLTQRGAVDVASARNYINTTLEADWSDPLLIPGMAEVAAALERAVRANWSIVIFGDYDVDGITAAALLSNLLTVLGAHPEVLLPLREGEGYGLSDAALEHILALKPDLLLTVDCGISAAESIAKLTANGISVLITDHHEATDAQALAVPAADPKLDPNCPQSLLSGAGVALKLAAILCERFGKPELWKSQLDLACLGTIGDLMAMIGENRSLVAAGLRQINEHPRPGIAAVMELTGKARQTVNAEELSFGLIPRLNAAGRVSDPMIAFDLLSCQDPSRARQLAHRLEDLNNQRKQLEATLMSLAAEQIETQPTGSASLVVGGQDWHEGVRGIVASRLARQYGLPTIVFSFEEDLAIGSGRSVGDINIYAAVSELADLLVRFGGHQAAIGVTIQREDFAEFKQRFEVLVQNLPPEQFDSADEIDCEVTFEHLSIEAIDELAILEPYGHANPEPRFLTTGLILKSARFVGSADRHLAFNLSDGQHELSAIWFSTPIKSIEELPVHVDVIYNARIDEWYGRRSIKLYVKDLFAHQDNVTASTPADDTAQATAKDRLEQALLLGTQNQVFSEIAQSISGKSLKLREIQRKCLETLEQRQATLAIMATGRGKSLIFQTFAASLALKQQTPSLFIYPLRSLIGDQEYFLSQALERIGLACACLTGTTPAAERLRIMQRVAAGSIAIVLSTPEYVLANAAQTDFWQSFGFLAIDEAHHIATSDLSFRPDYLRIEQLRVLLGEAVVLGLSATSDEATTAAIVKSLGIEQIVIDSSRRPNLKVADKRSSDNRQDELVRIVDQSQSTLVYVSTRAATMDLCKMLRQQLPHKAHRIAFYHAALETQDRYRVEAAFRAGELDCLVATSAFGEGVNIPDVRDVVLYDLPYSIIDFNQMAGRAGRDGLESTIHILANSDDVERLLGYMQASDADESALAERQASARQLKLFADWLFSANPDELLSVIQKPLTPIDGATNRITRDQGSQIEGLSR